MRTAGNNRIVWLLIAILCVGAVCFAAASPEPSASAPKAPVRAENEDQPYATPTPYKRIIPKDSTKKYNTKASDKSALVTRLPVLRIDGEPDAVWSICERYDLANPVFGESGAEASFRAYSDEDRLYLFIEVKDDTPRMSGEIATRSDCVEVFINEDGVKPTRYHAGDSHYIFIRNGVCEERSGADLRLLEYAVVSTEEGYTVELALQWSLMQEDRGNGIGFDIRINDSQGEGTRDYIVQWSDTSMMTHEDLSHVGTLYLR